jgi:hypothetical protein
LFGTFGALLAAGSRWAASPLLDLARGTGNALDSGADEDAVGTGFADYFTIYP